MAPRRWRSLLLLLLALAANLQAAERIISLTPAFNEIMLELDAGELLVGSVASEERPAQLAELPSVGRYDQLEMETLLSLRPDLVLAWSDSLSGAQRAQLQQLGIPLYEVAPRSLLELGEVLAELGARVGRAEQGLALQQRFNQRIATLQQQYARPQPLSVFYQVWQQPLYTLGGGQIVTDALAVCGARNVFADLTLPAPQVSIEAVLERNPQVILLSNAEQAAEWQRWPQLAAVQRQQVWAIADAGLERPSFQMLGAVEKLCRQLQVAQ